MVNAQANGSTSVGQPAVAVGEQQAGERVQQQQRRRLAEVVHLQRRIAVAPQHQQRDAEHHFAADQQGDHPERHDVAQRQGDQRADDVEPVGGRVEQRAEPAALVQPPGELAVEPSR